MGQMEASVVTLYVKPPLVASAFQIRVVTQVLAALLPVHLPANTSGKVADDGLCVWVSRIHMEDLDDFGLAQAWLLRSFGE